MFADCRLARFQWYNWPTVLTWKDVSPTFKSGLISHLLTALQCSNTCDKTEGCKSFSYNYAPDDGLVIAGVSCVLYYHTVESYTVPCSDNDNTPLETFFDKDCYPPARQTSGTVPAHPSTDDVNGTCDAARPLKNQHTFIGDQLGRGVTNSTQAQCGEGCKRQLDCKSYYVSTQFWTTRLITVQPLTRSPPRSSPTTRRAHITRSRTMSTNTTIRPDPRTSRRPAVQDFAST